MEWMRKEMATFHRERKRNKLQSSVQELRDRGTKKRKRKESPFDDEFDNFELISSYSDVSNKRTVHVYAY